MDSSGADHFAAEVCRRRIAGVCATLGWQSAQQSSLDLMNDLLRLYITRLGRDLKDSAEMCNRSRVGLQDVAATFARHSIDPEDLAEFAADTAKVPGVEGEPLPAFPAPCPLQLNHLKPGSQEVIHRKLHIHNHLPPMFPDDEQDGASGAAAASTGSTPAKPSDEASEPSGDGAWGAAPGGVGSAEQRVSSDALLQRDLSSVMMTAGGLISPAREGKLPESRGPIMAPPFSSAAATSHRSSDGFKATAADGDARGKGNKKLQVFQKKAPKAAASSSHQSGSRVPSPAPARPAQTPTSVALSADHADDVIERVIEKGIQDSDKKPKRKDKSPAKRKELPKEASSRLLKEPPPTQKPLFSESAVIPKQLYGFGSAAETEAAQGSGTSKKKSKEDRSKDKEKLGKKKKDKKKNKSEKGKLKLEKHKDKKGVEKIGKTKGMKIKIKDPSPSIVPPPKAPTKVVLKSHYPPEKRPRMMPSSDADSLFQEPLKIERHPPAAVASTSQAAQAKQLALAAAAAPMSGLPISTSNIIPSEQGRRAKRGKSSEDGAKKSKGKKTSKTSTSGSQSPIPSAAPTPPPKKRRKSGRPTSAAIVVSDDLDEVDLHDGGGGGAGGGEGGGGGGGGCGGGGMILEQTVGSYVDNEGNKIWICPACGKQDDGSPMIGCDEDGCDDWYHWLCVGIQQEPEESQNWYCQRCVSKKQQAAAKKKGRIKVR